MAEMEKIESSVSTEESDFQVPSRQGSILQPRSRTRSQIEISLSNLAVQLQIINSNIAS